MDIAFTVWGEPASKLRARTYTQLIKKGNYLKRVTNTVTPDKTVAYEKRVRIASNRARISAKLEPITDCVSIEVIAYMPIPTSWSKKRKTLAELGAVNHTTKPDCDNILKAVLDGMSVGKHKKGLYTDDVQVVSASVIKRYANTPRTEIKVSILRDYSKIYDICTRKAQLFFKIKGTDDVLCAVNSEQGKEIIENMRKVRK